VNTDRPQTERAPLDASPRQLNAETRAALDRVRAGAKCDVCHGPAVLARGGRLLCALDGNIVRQKKRADEMRLRKSSGRQPSIARLPRKQI
jgi:hypothetical protein